MSATAGYGAGLGKRPNSVVAWAAVPGWGHARSGRELAVWSWLIRLRSRSRIITGAHHRRPRSERGMVIRRWPRWPRWLRCRRRWWWPGWVRGRPLQDPRAIPAQPLIGVGGGVVVGVVGGVGVGEIGSDRFPAGVVGASEWADPAEVSGLGLGEGPAAVLVGVVAFTPGPDVDLDGLATEGVVVGVVQVGAACWAGAAGAAAVAVADADVVGEWAVGESGAGVGVGGQSVAQCVAPGPGGGDFGADRVSVAEGGVGGVTVGFVEGEVQFHHPAAYPTEPATGTRTRSGSGSVGVGVGSAA